MDKNKIFKILISSFSRDLMDSFCLLVEANGSIATKITSYSELKPELKNSNADLALIDEFVLFEGRKTNSFDLIKNLKTHIPVILVSSQKITNANHNIVYFIKKPISIGSLQSAIQTFTYMKQKDTKKEITKVGNVHYDAARRIIYYNDKEKLNFTSLENKIFQILSQNINKTYTRKILFDIVWGYSSNVDSQTIETHIWRMRKKLSKIKNFQYILKTEKEGYCLKKIS